MNIRPNLPKDFPKIVCLCGSTRFSDAFKEANLRETIAGNIVLSIGCDTKSDKDLMILGELTEEAKEKLDQLHKRKIDLADEILVLNVGGYVGDSTASEIRYAVVNNKEIRYIEPLTNKAQHCSICGWTNNNLLNLGRNNTPKMVCQGCCRRAVEELDSIKSMLLTARS